MTKTRPGPKMLDTQTTRISRSRRKQDAARTQTKRRRPPSPHFQLLLFLERFFGHLVDQPPGKRPRWRPAKEKDHGIENEQDQDGQDDRRGRLFLPPQRIVDGVVVLLSVLSVWISDSRKRMDHVPGDVRHREPLEEKELLHPKGYAREGEPVDGEEQQASSVDHDADVAQGSVEFERPEEHAYDDFCGEGDGKQRLI